MVWGSSTSASTRYTTVTVTPIWNTPRRRVSFQNMLATSGTSTRPIDEMSRVAAQLVPKRPSIQPTRSGMTHTSLVCLTTTLTRTMRKNRSRPKNGLQLPVRASRSDKNRQMTNVTTASSDTATPEAGWITNTEARYPGTTRPAQTQPKVSVKNSST